MHQRLAYTNIKKVADGQGNQLVLIMYLHGVLTEISSTPQGGRFQLILRGYFWILTALRTHTITPMLPLPGDEMRGRDAKVQFISTTRSPYWPIHRKVAPRTIYILTIYPQHSCSRASKADFCVCTGGSQAQHSWVAIMLAQAIRTHLCKQHQETLNSTVTQTERSCLL